MACHSLFLDLCFLLLFCSSLSFGELRIDPTDIHDRDHVLRGDQWLLGEKGIYWTPDVVEQPEAKLLLHPNSGDSSQLRHHQKSQILTSDGESKNLRKNEDQERPEMDALSYELDARNDILSPAALAELLNEEHEDGTKDKSSYTGEALKRSVTFRLGRRNDGKKRAPTFRLGKRESVDDLEKRTTGKRSDEEKRAPTFRLGKRNNEDKRTATSYHLGKREFTDEWERLVPVEKFRLGKWEEEEDQLDKRAPTFRLGKRREEEKRAPTFRLGKRNDEGKRAPTFRLGKREDKREVSDEE